jgi:hypothetical protein
MSVFLTACITEKTSIYQIEGEWYLNKSSYSDYDGKLIITNCSNKKCKLDLFVVQNGHTCGLDGTLDLIDGNFGIYSNAGKNNRVVFNMDKNILNVSCKNCRNIFCGAAADFIGGWTR